MPSSSKQKTIKNRSISTIQNTQSKRLATRISAQRHCPEDLACFQCCQCWINFKDSYNKRLKYFETKLLQSESENSLLKECLSKSAKQLAQIRAKLKNTKDLQTIKDNLRQELSKQLNEEVKLIDAIQKEKIQTLTQKLKESSSLISQLQQNLRIHSSQLNEYALNYQQKQNQCQNLRKQLKRQIQLSQSQKCFNLKLQQSVKALNHRIQDLKISLNAKDQNIDSLRSTIEHTERLILTKSSELAVKDFQNTTFKMQSSYKSEVMSKMQKVNEEQLKNISFLQTQKSKLNLLVGSLKDELHETDTYKNLLKIQLLNAETIALQKTATLQNIKYDLKMLKYTTPLQ